MRCVTNFQFKLRRNLERRQGDGKCSKKIKNKYISYTICQIDEDYYTKFCGIQKKEQFV